MYYSACNPKRYLYFPMKKASIPFNPSSASLNLQASAKKRKEKNAFFKTMDEAGKIARRNGLTEEKLQKILIELEAGSS